MKNFNRMLFGMMTATTLAFCFNVSTVKVCAQAEESVEVADAAEAADASDMIVIAALPETAAGERSGCEPWPEKLGLTDEQMEQLISLKSEYIIDTAKQKAELRANMKKLALLMTEPKLDKEAIMSLHEKINQLKTGLSDARVKHMLSAMNVMTEKQREEMHHHMLVHSLSHHHSWGKSHKPAPHRMHHSA